MNTTLDATQSPLPRRRSRRFFPRPARWLAAGLFLLAAGLAVWGAWSIGQAFWAGAADAAGLQGDFDVVVNGQHWPPGGQAGLLGWALAAAVVGGLLLLALTVLLPMALGAVFIGVLLLLGLVVGIVALPVLLVLALLLSPLLALGGLAWMLFG